MSRRRIGIDADGVLFDYVSSCAVIVNGLTGDNRASYNTALHYNTLKCWSAGHLKYAVDRIYENDYNVLNIPVISGAREFIEEVRDITDNNFVIITACPATWHNQREISLEYNFGIPREKVHFSRDKSIFNVSALIDDYHGNFNGFNGFRLLLDRPWNRNTEGTSCFRCNDYDHVIDKLKEIW